mgnify:CR=1 FL=1
MEITTKRLREIITEEIRNVPHRRPATLPQPLEIVAPLLILG